MQKEQIVKALKWCSELRLCVDCPMRAEGYFTHSGNACRQALMQNALSLIREQEKRIEELTLENAGFEAGAKAAAKFIRGDTVRKMVERLKAEAITIQDHAGNLGSVVLASTIDQIANQLLEDTK